MSDEIRIEPAWGTYAPPPDAAVLLSLVKFGLARGAVSKWIRQRWLNCYPTLVDAEVRGIKYRLNISDNTTDGKLLLSSKNYDGKEIEALAIRGGEVFVDIGANTGYYSLTMAGRGFKKVIAIEPNPPTLKRLETNIALNDLSGKIRVVPLCVGEEGIVDFFCDGSLGSGSLLQERADIEPIRIPSKPLISILKENLIDKIDCMKIDVEGVEDRALLPFFAKAGNDLWPRVLVLEHCHRDQWDTDLLGYLVAHGYELVAETRANYIMRRTVAE